MTPERWQRIKKVLEVTLELEPSERSAYLDETCAADPTLRRDVESFIVAKEEHGSGFLEVPALSLVGLAKGARLGAYEIVELLGAGGMGEVYRAHDERLDRDVALKVLPAGMLSHEDARRRFRNEALALGRLSHPNIETVYEFDTQGGVDFLVMECIPGVTLSEKVATGPLPEKEATKLGVQLAQGLAAAHARGVLHRDLSPANLRITPEGQLKILDFGLAKLFEASETAGVKQPKTQTQTIAGTLAYMAPEQLRGDPADTRTDIYAAGAVLYEMVAGQRLFPEAEGPQLMDAIRCKKAPPPSAISVGISPQLEGIILKALEKKPDRRYQSAGELLTDLEWLGTPAAAAIPTGAPSRWRRRLWVIGTAALAGVAALAAGGYWLSQRKVPPLSERDTVVLADFANKTGDRIFDDTLKEALSVSLRQSPFLNILSDEKVGETLKMMTKPPDTGMTRDVAREVCQRAGSKAYIGGSIASLGNHYVIGLNATNCATGDTLAQEQVEAASKEKVLDALGKAATKLRGELGESLARVRKFDVPLEQATTPSLDALQVYSLGVKTMVGNHDPAAALPFFQQAIRLDPNFAMAYASLGTNYSSLGEDSLARESTQKAYELRERVSERERLYLESHFYEMVTGDLEKARQAYELWAQTYPRDDIPPNDLGDIYVNLGQYDKALAEYRETFRLNPGSRLGYDNLVSTYLFLNRLKEAQATAEEAQAKELDSPALGSYLYELAFLQNDAPGMTQQVTSSAGKPGVEDVLLYLEADTAAYFGRVAKARELSRQAVASAGRADEKEAAAGYEAEAALREALFGNGAVARQRAAAALKLSTGRHVQFVAALALGFAGGAAGAQARRLADDLGRRFPRDTIVQFNYLPTLRAQLALNRSDATKSSAAFSSKAIEALQAAMPYELGAPANGALSLNLYPVYVRGEAFLSGHQGSEAAAEFQKILGQRGVVFNEPIGALAHLGLARAYALEAHSAQGPDADATRAKARAAYQDFLTLWKDADPGIPVLEQAKSDYAKLK